MVFDDTVLDKTGLTQDDRKIFDQFLQRVEILDLVSIDAVLIEKIIEIRQEHRLKLPDAVIAAIAIQNTEHLKTEEDIQLYLEACLEEAGDDPRGSSMPLALSLVLKI